MKETTRQAAIEAVNKHDFLFLIAGTRNKDGSFNTQRIIEGKTCVSQEFNQNKKKGKNKND